MCLLIFETLSLIATSPTMESPTMTVILGAAEYEITAIKTAQDLEGILLLRRFALLLFEGAAAGAREYNKAYIKSAARIVRRCKPSSMSPSVSSRRESAVIDN